MNDMECGPQPLNGLMDSWGLRNHDLVDASTEQLTHKQVQRARNGRRLTLRMMQKVMRALNVAIWQRFTDEQKEAFVEYTTANIFNYAKGFRDEWTDPNLVLREERS
jgi:hypothetical protein